MDSHLAAPALLSSLHLEASSGDTKKEAALEGPILPLRQNQIEEASKSRKGLFVGSKAQKAYPERKTMPKNAQEGINS